MKGRQRTRSRPIYIYVYICARESVIWPLFPQFVVSNLTTWLSVICPRPFSHCKNRGLSGASACLECRAEWPNLRAFGWRVCYVAHFQTSRVTKSLGEWWCVWSCDGLGSLLAIACGQKSPIKIVFFFFISPVWYLSCCRFRLGGSSIKFCKMNFWKFRISDFSQTYGETLVSRYVFRQKFHKIWDCRKFSAAPAFGGRGKWWQKIGERRFISLCWFCRFESFTRDKEMKK